MEFLDEQIECAIREKGVKDRYRELEAQSRMSDHRPVKRRWVVPFASVAASLAVACVGVDVKESSDARTAYHAYTDSPSETYRSSGLPLDLEGIKEKLDILDMEEHSFKECEIDPEYRDEYMEQIAFERQSLRFSEALYHLGKGHFIRARRLLKEISASDGAYAAEALSLLEML